jgi:hypothetical protein
MSQCVGAWCISVRWGGGGVDARPLVSHSHHHHGHLLLLLLVPMLSPTANIWFHWLLLLPVAVVTFVVAGVVRLC